MSKKKQHPKTPKTQVKIPPIAMRRKFTIENWLSVQDALGDYLTSKQEKKDYSVFCFILECELIRVWDKGFLMGKAKSFK